LKLYELVSEYGKLQDRLELIETDQQSILDELNRIEGELTYKSEQIAKMILSLESNIACCDDEIKRLSSKKKAYENKVEWLKSYLLQSLKDAQMDKIKGEVCNIAIRQNPISIRILSQSEIPPEFLVQHAPTVDKVAITQHFKETGEIVSGTEIVRTERVDIR